jgi:hypothetical protein
VVASKATAKRVFESERPRSGRVSLAIIFVFPESEKLRDTKCREDRCEAEPAQLAQALLQECEKFAIFFQFFP